MAQWSHAKRTLHAKIVYYGPALGGKTANLESLRDATDPRGLRKLLSIQTTDDRTLFYDLLTVELEDILGYRIVVRLFGVPGQVRYDAARKVVLPGADAIVFVADSRVGREEQNRWSLQNLQMNMRANRLAGSGVPVIYQFNKQDLADAATPEEVAGWLRIPREEAFTAVATEGRGVLSTFKAASRLMLENLLTHGDDEALSKFDVREIGPQVEAAFAPFVARQEWRVRCAAASDGDSHGSRESLVFKGEELLQDSIRTSARLGERFLATSSRACDLQREAEAYRALCDARLAEGAGITGVVTDAISAAAVSLVRISDGGQPVLDSICGRAEDPLLATAWGRRMVSELCMAREPCIIADLHRECADPEARRAVVGIRAVAVVPVESSLPRLMLVYAALPDGAFSKREMRYLETAAGLIGAGLQRADLPRELQGHGEKLLQIRDGLRDMEASQHGFLRGISHRSQELLADVHDAAVFLRDKRSQGRKRIEALATIIDSVETLQDQQEELICTSERMQERVEMMLRLIDGRREDEVENPDLSEREVINAG
jgi:signal recognition particle receptor subunit beta